MTPSHFQRALLTLFIVALGLIAFGRYTDIDRALSDAMFDFHTMAFPWRDNWFAAEFMHSFMKALLIGIGLVPVVVLIADRVMARTLLEAHIRRKLYLVVGCFALVPAAISIMKNMSIHHCPWNLTRYGGFAPYLRIFDSLPASVSAGKCFPAGHASSGLWLASVAVFWLPGRPGKALLIFCMGLMPGIMLGLVQQLRGAHFLTHTLWSAWIAALITIVLAWLMCKSSAQATGQTECADQAALPVEQY